jgi:hypothetical protein
MTGDELCVGPMVWLGFFPLLLSVQLVIGSHWEKETETNSLHQWCRYIHSTPEPEVIIFNRFMKCGSSTMNSIISRLQKIHPSFYFYSQNGVDWQRAKPDQLYQSLQEVLRASNHSRMVVEGHFPWKDFGDIKVNMEYIQLLRNCPDRHTSNFFYRLPNHGKDLQPQLLSCLLNEKCINEKTDIMYMGTNDYSETFCGGPCNVPSVLEHIHPPGLGQFTVVGLLEHFLEYLEMLECVYPSIFRDVLALPKLLQMRENVSGGSNRTQSRVVRQVIAGKCAGSSDENVYLAMEEIFSKRFEFMKQHRGECCRDRTRR